MTITFVATSMIYFHDTKKNFFFLFVYAGSALLEYDHFNDYRLFSGREPPFLNNWNEEFRDAMRQLAVDQLDTSIEHESVMIYNEILECIARES